MFELLTSGKVFVDDEDVDTIERLAKAGLVKLHDIEEEIVAVLTKTGKRALETLMFNITSYKDSTCALCEKQLKVFHAVADDGSIDADFCPKCLGKQMEIRRTGNGKSKYSGDANKPPQEKHDGDLFHHGDQD